MLAMVSSPIAFGVRSPTEGWMCHEVQPRDTERDCPDALALNTPFECRSVEPKTGRDMSKSE